MRLKSLEGCRLTIGSYPPFSYNACGGGGKGTLHPGREANLLYVNFSSQTFSIPPLVSQTTKFLYLQAPPLSHLLSYDAFSEKQLEYRALRFVLIAAMMGLPLMAYLNI